MTNIKFTRAVFFVLVMAMLSMQWSKAHIHLAEHHDHGGSHHQHTTSVHTHLSLTQNNHNIETIAQSNVHETNVVELDNNCKLHKCNSLDDQPLVLTLVTNQLSSSSSQTSAELSAFRHSKRRYIDYSELHLRAPPTLS